MSERLEALRSWLRAEAGLPDCELVPASGDASFRRYFRLRWDGRTAIAMDAPPEREDSRPFLRLAAMLHGYGLQVPEVLAADADLGFALLGDLGDRQYLAALTPATVERLYGDALGALLTLQAHGPVEAGEIPPYDDALLQREMALFPDWLLERELGLDLGEGARSALGEAFQLLEASALEQPPVLVHRDYHSRNLMVTERNNPGILDFQDAVVGPVTYDLVSLLRDCYIAWPREAVEEWALGYQDLALQSGVLREEDPERFLRWFDLMGVQRHLKAAGIFARLWHRDGKRGYLKDVPRTVGYIRAVAPRYPEFKEFSTFLEREVAPRLDRLAEGWS